MIFSIKGLSAALLTWATIANAFCTEANICATAVIPKTSSQDLYLQITAPSNAGWAGVGLGTRMKGALIFVIHPDTAGKNLTLSPRIATGNIEPQYESSIDATILEGTEIKDGKWTMNLVCHNCRSWDGGSLDVTSSSASFIYAFGGGDTISDDKADAGIYHHAIRGFFSLNLAAATTGTGGNPFITTKDTTGGTNNDTTGGTNNDTKDDSGNDAGDDKGQTGGSEDSGNSAMSKTDRSLLAHGMAFVFASALIISFL